MLCSFSCVSLFHSFCMEPGPIECAEPAPKSVGRKNALYCARRHAADNSISIQTAEWIWIIVIIYWNIKLCFSRSSLSLLCGGFFMQDHDEENRLAFSAMRNWKNLSPTLHLHRAHFFPTIHLCHPTMTTTKNHLNCYENTGRWNSAPVLLKCPLQIFFRWMNLDFDRSWVFKAINIFSSLQIRQEKPYYVADPEVDSLVSIFLLLLPAPADVNNIHLMFFV